VFKLVEKMPRAGNFNGILTVITGQSALDLADICIPGTSRVNGAT
jgi:hypothetical protein